MFMCAGEGESWSSRTMSGFQLWVAWWMLRLEGLVLFRRESEGWMVSGWTIGLVGGVENMGVAGESIVVGPDMVGTGGYCKCWSLLQVLLYLYGSMFNLILGTTSDGDGEKMENSRHASSRRREGNSSTSGSLTAIAFRIISHWLSDVQSPTCTRPPSLCSLILQDLLLHLRYFSSLRLRPY